MMRWHSVVGFAATLSALAACGGGGGKYAGTWKRDLYGEGEVHMKLASNGGVELMLPSPQMAGLRGHEGTGPLQWRHPGLQGAILRAVPARRRSNDTWSAATRISST